MITDKDRENAVSMTKIWIRDSEGNQLEDIAGIIARIRAESADQARKEAAELKSVLSLWYEWSSKESVKIDDKDYGMVTQTAAILGDSAPVSTDSEKLAIAVKALKWAIEYIGDGHLPEDTPDHECGYKIAPDEGYCEFCENYWNARDALKEIQG